MRPSETMLLMMKKIGPLLLVLASLAVFFSFGFYRLGKFATVDEHYWIGDSTEGRIRQYWRGWELRNWGMTYINDKPGVTVAILGGLALPFEAEPQRKLAYDSEYYRIYDNARTERSGLIFRMPVLIFNGLAGLYFFWILGKVLAGRWQAAVASAAILASPILLGISCIVNPDSLLWSTAAAAIFSFLAYLKLQMKRFAALTGVFFGLAVLSKYSAIILGYYFWIAMLTYLWLEIRRDDLSELRRNVIRCGVDYLQINVWMFIVFILLWPATWNDPTLILKGTIGFGGTEFVYLSMIFATIALMYEARLNNSRALNWLLAGLDRVKRYVTGMVFLALSAVAILILVNWNLKSGFDPRIFNVQFDEGLGEVFVESPLFYKIVLEMVPLVFSLTPATLLMLLSAWIMPLFRKTQDFFILFALTLFFPLFYAAVIRTDLLVNIRYAIMLYPLAIVLGVMGLFQLAEVMGRYRRQMLVAGIVLMFASGIWAMWTIKPFYFNYTSDLLPKSRIITGAWGYGGYEAAEYLNALPEAENLVVWADTNGFCQFFKGTCIKGNRDLKLWTSLDKTQNRPIDYVLMTRRGSVMYKEIYERFDAKVIIDPDDPVFRIDIGSRPANHVMLFKVLDYQKLIKK